MSTKDYGEYRETYRGEDEIGEAYRELTLRGKLVCAGAGLLEEAAVFLAFEIQLRLAPVVTVLFLWLLFAILTGALMLGADELRVRAAARAAVHGPAEDGGEKIRRLPDMGGHLRAS